MPASENTRPYVVGYLVHHDNRPASPPRDCLNVLGEYSASHPKGAVEAALADDGNGGVPNPKSQVLVAVVKSSWYEFAGSSRQETVWDVEPVVEAEVIG